MSEICTEAASAIAPWDATDAARSSGMAPPRRTLVISGVGMTEGGLLSVLRHLVAAAERLLEPHWRIVALVHRKSLIDASRAELLEFPELKASWLKRVDFEWRRSRLLARELSADVWFCAHDITALVDVERQYVYCHNPTCFAPPTLSALYFDWVFVAHALLYGRLYSLNVRRNTEVFVQQAWIRDVFLQRFHARSVIVSRPALESCEARPPTGAPARVLQRALRRWIYPTFARHFKNVEVVGRALEILERSVTWTGEVLITIGGYENRYARWLEHRFRHLRSLRFIGRQTPAQMEDLYAGADGLLFPSKLETWGLPITEAQARGLPMLVADLPYAHETVGTYDGVMFFDPEDSRALADLLGRLARGDLVPGRAVAALSSDARYLLGWDALVREICGLNDTHGEH